MTDFRSSEFNDQKLNKSRIQQSEGQFKESYHKNISKTNTYFCQSILFVMQNSFSRNASTYLIELSDLYSDPQIKVYQIYSMFLDLFYWDIRNESDGSFAPPSQNAMHNIIQKCYKSCNVNQIYSLLFWIVILSLTIQWNFYAKAWSSPWMRADRAVIGKVHKNRNSFTFQRTK